MSWREIPWIHCRLPARTEKFADSGQKSSIFALKLNKVAVKFVGAANSAGKISLQSRTHLENHLSQRFLGQGGFGRLRKTLLPKSEDVPVPYIVRLGFNLLVNPQFAIAR